MQYVLPSIVVHLIQMVGIQDLIGVVCNGVVNRLRQSLSFLWLDQPLIGVEVVLYLGQQWSHLQIFDAEITPRSPLATAGFFKFLAKAFWFLLCYHETSFKKIHCTTVRVYSVLSVSSINVPQKLDQCRPQTKKKKNKWKPKQNPQRHPPSTNRGARKRQDRLVLAIGVSMDCCQ